MKTRHFRDYFPRGTIACASLAYCSSAFGAEIRSATAGANSTVAKPSVNTVGTFTQAPAGVLPTNPTDAQIFGARVLVEPLVPIYPASSANENSALGNAINQYKASKGAAISSFEAFVAANPNSRWTPSVDLSIGLLYFSTSHFTKAIASYDAAWNLTKAITSGTGKAIADRAFAEELQMYARLGDRNILTNMLTSVKGRQFTGVSAELVDNARDGLALMNSRPDLAFRCGPGALEKILANKEKSNGFNPALFNSRSTANGISLAAVKAMSSKVGLNLQAAKRSPGAQIITPAVVHWRLGHYAALFGTGNNLRVEDPTFGRHMTADIATIDSESSGYFLVPVGSLPAGWTPVSESEADTVFGKGATSQRSGGQTGQTGQTAGGDGGQSQSSGGNDGGGQSNGGGDGGQSSGGNDDGGQSDGGGDGGQSAGGYNGTGPGDSGCSGMTVADAILMVVSLKLSDIPVGYVPPLGPSVFFKATYNQQEDTQPTTFDFANLGYQWVHNWNSYILETRVQTVTISTSSWSGGDTGSDGVITNVTQVTPVMYKPGGGYDEYGLTEEGSTTTAEAGTPYASVVTDVTNAFSVNPGSYPCAIASALYSSQQLVKTSATTYELRYGDGSKLVYALQQNLSSTFSGSSNLETTPDEVSTMSNRYFLTQSVDASGNSVTVTYDTYNRITTLTDALGQVTTFSYTLSADPLKITKVTDPFGRYASFEYDSSNRLIQITDVIGIESQYAYPGTSNFIASLTTPYGTSTFSYATATAEGNPTRNRSLQLTDPAGGVQLIQDQDTFTGIPYDTVSAELPSGMTVQDISENYRNTLYWSKKAMRDRPNDINAATIYHWCHESTNVVSGILENKKMPFENRVFYNYPGQTEPYLVGSSPLQTAVGRVLDDGSSQVSTYTYNSAGKLLTRTDPLGRVTTYTYASNGVDLAEVQQTVSSGSEVLAQYTYNSAHEILSATDASGQVTTYTYNSAGLLSTKTNALGQEIKYFYDPSGNPAGSRLTGGARDPSAIGYLVAIDNPLASTSDTETIAYDSYGRPETVTDSEGYAVTTAYDAFDRPTTVTYPDGTYKQITYSNLDVAATQDRRGRVTSYSHNSLRRLVLARDPLGRTTQFSWCTCGDLLSIIDGNGRTTSMTYDIQGRLIQKIFSDGSTKVTNYENTTSRVKTKIDALGQKTNYTYYNDNTIHEISYTNAVNSTPSITFAYDTYYPRMTSMVDGIGTTSYTYNSIPSTPGLGAGRLATIAGPLSGESIAYSYDELGRVTSKEVGGSSNIQTTSFDSIGRANSIGNALGTFGYSFVDATPRIASISYPNGQTTNYSYYPKVASTGGNGDQRLETIQNLNASSGNISSYTYTYDLEGIIQTWSKQLDSSSAVSSSLSYDLDDQLTSVTGSTNYNYAYDLAGNRTQETIGSSASFAQANNLNELISISSISPTTFSGTLNKSASVSINGQPATVTGTSFSASVPLAPGSNNVQVVAVDSHGLATSKNYQVTVSSGSTATLTYDLDGNLLNDGSGKAYQWDASNRLIKITQTSGTSTFTYDGFGRRVQESLNGSLVKQWVWSDGLQPDEEWNSSGSVTKRFFPGGEQISGTAYFFTKDHLGSVREVADGSGTLDARYDYDSFGRSTTVSGSFVADFGFEGYFLHSASGLNLTAHRAYSPNLGRWLSRDPLLGAERKQGTNLYSFVNNNPANHIDNNGELISNPVVIAVIAVVVIIAYVDVVIFGQGKQHPPAPPPSPPPQRTPVQNSNSCPVPEGGENEDGPPAVPPTGPKSGPLDPQGPNDDWWKTEGGQPPEIEFD